MATTLAHITFLKYCKQRSRLGEAVAHVHADKRVVLGERDAVAVVPHGHRLSPVGGVDGVSVQRFRNVSGVETCNVPLSRVGSRTGCEVLVW